MFLVNIDLPVKSTILMEILSTFRLLKFKWTPFFSALKEALKKLLNEFSSIPEPDFRKKS